MAWLTEGPLTAPTAGTLLAQTGTIPSQPGPTVLPRVLLSATAIVSVRIEHRNAANAANLTAHTMGIPANQPVELALGGGVRVSAGERFRVVMAANAGAGVVVQASIFR